MSAYTEEYVPAYTGDGENVPAYTGKYVPTYTKEHVPLYIKTAKRIAELTLSPCESNRDALPKAIMQAFDVLPTVKEHDAYLGAPLQADPDLSEWEILPDQGHERSKVLAAGVKTIHGQLRWHSPSVMNNINPTPLLDTVAASAIVNTYSPNMLWDFVSAGGQATERQVLRQIGRLVGWDEAQPEGAFTFGGKGCLINAIRTGLNRCVQNVASEGLPNGPKPVVIASLSNHDCIATVCSLLGLGEKAWLKIPTLTDGSISLKHYREVLRDVMTKGIPIACIIASGGDTLDVSADSPLQMRKIMEEEAEKVKLSYKPFLYFDTVVSWPWMTFKDYNWELNPLEIKDNIAYKLREVGRRLSEANACDAIGVDFHKIGLVAYQSSVFVIRNAAEFHSIYKDKQEKLPRQPHGNNFIQHHTLEHSRSFAPVLSAWISLQNLGINGLRSYLAHMTEIGSIFQEVLPQYNIEHVNPYGLGFAGVFWPKRKTGPESFAHLIEASPETIKKCNDHTFALFGELAYPTDNARSIILRYVPQFQLSKSGLPIGTLVVFPMGISTTIELAHELAHEIGRKAQKIQSMASPVNNLAYEAPNHVPM